MSVVDEADREPCCIEAARPRRGWGVGVVTKPKVTPVWMPSFLFVELSWHDVRDLHHRRKELFLAPT